MRIHTFALGPFQTNTYLVEDETTKQAILIDPTIDSESVLDKATARGLTIALILDTHGHVDHVYGNAFFKEQTGAPLAIHADDAPWLRSITQHATLFGIPARVSPEADRLLRDGDHIAVADLSFTVIHTPGHTPGSICLYGHGVLFAGDTLFEGSVGRTDLPGGNHEQLISSIKTKLLALPEQTTVYSGHGGTTTIGEEKEYNPFLS